MTSKLQEGEVSKELLHKIEQLNERCPIEFPDQLYLRKGDEYIESYDPVFSMKVNRDTLFIEGYNHIVYEHNTKEFDSIYITQDEPVDLHSTMERIETDE